LENSISLFLAKSVLQKDKTLDIGGSKSISNRLLILQKCFGNFQIENLSDAEDTSLLQKALSTEENLIDVHHAGTAMRFLTSYFACTQNANKTLTGSERLQERPIKDLVDALRELGADIEYVKKEGFPPLEIHGKKITNNDVEINASVSSQFLTSLLLVAAKLENGLDLKLLGELTSKPYLEMTVAMLKEMSIEANWQENKISVMPQTKNLTIDTKIVESDWSSAGYIYSFAAIGRKKISMRNFFQNSMQGDSRVQQIFLENFGIKTIFQPDNRTIMLIPIDNFEFPKEIKLNMNDCPDIAQTICVTAATLKIHFHFTGLQTLIIKETNRLTALKNELEKIGCTTSITGNAIQSLEFNKTDKKITISTYQDHRIAMSFAPFCLVQEIEIENPEVVKKSYPNFWKDLEKIVK
jgi:3-phosphoshikimate 1-carboxyvinyltransferase